MDDKLYQKIYDNLVAVLPDDWKKVAFYAEYTEGSYSMKYYVDQGSGEYIDCYKMDGVQKTTIVKTFININKDISLNRMKLDPDKRWNVITLLINHDGTFKAEYDYSDVSENTIAFHEQWKKKYLN